MDLFIKLILDSHYKTTYSILNYFNSWSEVRRPQRIIISKPNPFWSLVPLSFEEVKRDWILYFNEIERKLAKAKKEWNHFETEARVLYQTWYHSTFSRELSILREIEEESNQLARTLDAIEAQIAVNGLTRRVAFLKVRVAMKDKHDPFPTDEELAAFRKKQTQVFHDEFSKRLSQGGKHEVNIDLLECIRRETIAQAMNRFGPPRSDEDARLMNDWIGNKIMERYQARNEVPNKSSEEIPPKMKNLFDDLFEELGIEEDTEFDEDEASRANATRSSVNTHGNSNTNSGNGTNSNHRDYKTLYRQVVRLLHPDRGTPMNETEKELWSQAQIAYREHNEDLLRAILLRIEGGGKINVSKLQSIGDIRELTLQLHFEYDEINFIKSQVKKEPLYRFWASRKRPTNRKKLENQITAEIKTSIHYGKQKLNQLLSEVNRMERQYLKSSF